jgi:hypothetical protein
VSSGAPNWGNSHGRKSFSYRFTPTVMLIIVLSVWSFPSFTSGYSAFSAAASASPALWDWSSAPAATSTVMPITRPKKMTLIG